MTSRQFWSMLNERWRQSCGTVAFDQYQSTLFEQGFKRANTDGDILGEEMPRRHAHVQPRQKTLAIQTSAEESNAVKQLAANLATSDDEIVVVLPRIGFDQVS